MKEIPLTQNKIALIDDDDYERVSKHKWCALKRKNGVWYAVSWVHGKVVRMHVFIVGKRSGYIIHHEDMNGLNNRKMNLVYRTYQEHYKLHGNGYRYKKTNGYNFVRQRGKWEVKFGYEGQCIYLGQFSTVIEAKEVHDSIWL
jgi:hypothetical protein